MSLIRCRRPFGLDRCRRSMPAARIYVAYVYARERQGGNGVLLQQHATVIRMFSVKTAHSPLDSCHGVNPYILRNKRGKRTAGSDCRFPSSMPVAAADSSTRSSTSFAAYNRAEEIRRKIRMHRTSSAENRLHRKAVTLITSSSSTLMVQHRLFKSLHRVISDNESPNAIRYRCGREGWF